MKTNYVDTESWYDDDQKASFQDQGKRQLGQIRDILREGCATQIYLDYCEQGKKLATELNAPYWYLYFEVSYTEGKVLSTKSRAERLKFATQLYIKSNKTRYEGCPYRSHAYVLLLDQYTLNDPIGYADLIQEGIQYCYDNLPLTPKLHHQLCDVQVKLDIAIEDWDVAEESALRFQSIFDSHPPTILQTSLYLCEIAYKQSRPKKLDQYIKSAENALSHDSKQAYRVIILYWQSILARLYGQTGVATLSSDQRLQAMVQGLPAITPEIAIVQFYYAVETKQVHLPDSLLSPLKYDSLGDYYRAVAALRFLYAYQRATARAQANIIIPYVMIRLENTSAIQQTINFITAPLPYIGEKRKSPQPIMRMLWTVIYLLIFIPYVPIYIVMMPVARLFIKPDQEIPKFINGLLAKSKSLPIFQQRLERLANDPSYIP